MQIVRSPLIAESLAGTSLFFDTNVLNVINNFPSLLDSLLRELKAKGCKFLTIPQVQFEFTRGSCDQNEYREKTNLIERLMLLYPVDKDVNEFPELVLTMHKVASSASYVDYLLGLCLCKFKSAYLITGDARAMSTNLFDRDFLITIDTDKDIQTYGIYKVSTAKMEKIAKQLRK